MVYVTGPAYTPLAGNHARGSVILFSFSFLRLKKVYAPINARRAPIHSYILKCIILDSCIVFFFFFFAM